MTYSDGGQAINRGSQVHQSLIKSLSKTQKSAKSSSGSKGPKFDQDLEDAEKNPDRPKNHSVSVGDDGKIRFEAKKQGGRSASEYDPKEAIKSEGPREETPDFKESIEKSKEPDSETKLINAMVALVSPKLQSSVSRLPESLQPYVEDMMHMAQSMTLENGEKLTKFIFRKPPISITFHDDQDGMKIQIKGGEPAYDLIQDLSQAQDDVLAILKKVFQDKDIELMVIADSKWEESLPFDQSGGQREQQQDDSDDQRPEDTASDRIMDQ